MARCGLSSGSRVLEIGPGTGLVTRHLLEAGGSVVAVEPDPGLAGYLRATVPGALEVVESTIEEVDLDEGGFDLAVAATSFHWVRQQTGLEKIASSLRPGGWCALWWTLFRDPTSSDEFSRAVEGLLGPNTRGAFDEPGRPPFQLDIDRRIDDMHRWGELEDVSAETFRTTCTLDAGEVRDLYGSMATVLRRSRAEQGDLLRAVETLVIEGFGGQVERQFVSALYTGRRPPSMPNHLIG